MGGSKTVNPVVSHTDCASEGLWVPEDEVPFVVRVARCEVLYPQLLEECLVYCPILLREKTESSVVHM